MSPTCLSNNTDADDSVGGSWSGVGLRIGPSNVPGRVAEVDDGIVPCLCSPVQ
jgi:hypothetical protein